MACVSKKWRRKGPLKTAALSKFCHNYFSKKIKKLNLARDRLLPEEMPTPKKKPKVYKIIK